MGGENNDDNSSYEEEALQEVKNAYNFSIGINSVQQIAEALAQLDISGAISPFREVLQKQPSLFEALGRQLKEAVEPIGKVGLFIADEIAAALKGPYTNYAEAVRKALEGTGFPNIDEGYLIARVDSLAMDYGWPPIYQLTPRSIQALFDEAQEHGDEAERQTYIDGQIVQFYRDSLDSLLASWECQPLLKDTERLIIIKDGLEAHRKGKYSLSSPAILAQIEGLFIEHLESGRGKSIGTGHYRKHLEKLRSERGAKGLTYGLAAALYKFVENHGLFGTDVPTNPISHISRHAILHGRSTAYCMREDISLRHILWLDCVIKLVNALNPDAQHRRKE